MARYSIPSNTGKLRVVVGHGGTFAAWNGKIGPLEFRVLARTKKIAEEVARIVNAREHHGAIDVLDSGVSVPDAEDVQRDIERARLPRAKRAGKEKR
jgi:hypothetical protein